MTRRRPLIVLSVALLIAAGIPWLRHVAAVRQWQEREGHTRHFHWREWFGQKIYVNSRHPHCANNLRYVNIVLQTYHVDHDCLPPQCLMDEHGQPAHSWRTLLLPHLERDHLYSRYHFDEPWNGPRNQELHALVAESDRHRCPLDVASSGPSGFTSFVAVIGDHTAWRLRQNATFADVSDAPGQTILLVELPGSDIHWFEPRDLTVDEFVTLCGDIARGARKANHTTRPLWMQTEGQPFLHVGLVDGSIQRLPVSTPPDVLKALLTIDGGEIIDSPWLK